MGLAGLPGRPPMSAEAQPSRQAPIRGRIDAIDIARGVALVAMAIYHFTWDLEFFGYAEPGLTQQGGWKLFARCIASSFLFLVGISLVLGHSDGIRWRGFGRRLLQIAAAAALITIATWFATPDRFIFFGILHQIALASVIGLALLRAPVWVLIAVAAVVIAGPHFLRNELLAYPVFWWLGLAPADPPSNDYVPVFPWTGAVLIGIATGKLMKQAGLFETLQGYTVGGWALPIRFSGRHSLAFYLLHQPVLIGCIWLFAQIWPADARPPEFRFLQSCERSCKAGDSGIDCTAYCICVLDEIDQAGRLDDVLAGVSDSALQTQLTDIAGQCSRSVHEMTPDADQ